MWRSIISQIKKEGRSNLWVFIELFVVTILMWYCIDFMYVVFSKRGEPMGVNTENVYRLRLRANPILYAEIQNTIANPDSAMKNWINPFLQIVRLVDEYPGVEATAYYSGSEPYDPNVMFQGYTTDGKGAYGSKIRYVSEHYSDVFKVDIIQGNFSNWGINENPQGAVISKELADSLFNNRNVVGEMFYDYYEPSLKFKVAGVCESMKYDTYSRLEPLIYTPFNLIRLSYTIPIIGLRVTKEADTRDFAERFMEEMKTKLNIGPFYLFGIISYDDKASYYDTNSGISKYITTITSVILFFSFIIFLGLLGTFWFKMESRRSEIGLRMALGSTRKEIIKNSALESITIFLFAFIPALIVCFSLYYWDIIYTYNNCMDYTVWRFVISILFTVLVIIVMILLGVLPPAYRASKTEPVEALKTE